MNIVTVSLFGHRVIHNLQQLHTQLAPLIKELIQSNSYVDFLIGRNGEFDEYAASIVKAVQKKSGRENSDLSLVLPYTVADLDYYEKYYDRVVVPDCMYKVYPKAAITLRNRWMIEQSNLIIVYVEKKEGGAYAAMNYAKKMDKRVIVLSST